VKGAPKRKDKDKKRDMRGRKLKSETKWLGIGKCAECNGHKRKKRTAGGKAENCAYELGVEQDNR